MISPSEIRRILREKNLLVAVLCLAWLSACSMADSKPEEENGHADIHGSAPRSDPVRAQMESTAWPGEPCSADQSGLEATIAQLLEDQKKYETRLHKLEAIILNGYPIASMPDYPARGIPASSSRSASQLASLPIEPQVITHPRRKRASSGTSRARRMVTAAGQGEAAKHLVPSRPHRPANDRGSWVINLGSYSKKKIADRMLAEFRRHDSAAEQITALVKDMTMYRVRIAGFDTRQAAAEHAQVLQERLGIPDIWIAHK